MRARSRRHSIVPAATTADLGWPERQQIVATPDRRVTPGDASGIPATQVLPCLLLVALWRSIPLIADRRSTRARRSERREEEHATSNRGAGGHCVGGVRGAGAVLRRILRHHDQPHDDISATPTPPTTTAPVTPPGYLSARGTHIVDSSGTVVQLTGYNVTGMESTNPDGTDVPGVCNNGWRPLTSGEVAQIAGYGLTLGTAAGGLGEPRTVAADRRSGRNPRTPLEPSLHHRAGQRGQSTRCRAPAGDPRHAPVELECRLHRPGDRQEAGLSWFGHARLAQSGGGGRDLPGRGVQLLLGPDRTGRTRFGVGGLRGCRVVSRRPVHQQPHRRRHRTS